MKKFPTKINLLLVLLIVMLFASLSVLSKYPFDLDSQMYAFLGLKHLFLPIIVLAFLLTISNIYFIFKPSKYAKWPLFISLILFLCSDLIVAYGIFSDIESARLFYETNVEIFDPTKQDFIFSQSGPFMIVIVSFSIYSTMAYLGHKSQDYFEGKPKRKIAKENKTHKKDGEALEVTWGLTLKVWWSFVWRSIFFGVASGFLAVISLNFIGSILNLEIAPKIIDLLSSIAGMIGGIYALKVVLSKSFNKHRIVIISQSDKRE